LKQAKAEFPDEEEEWKLSLDKVNNFLVLLLIISEKEGHSHISFSGLYHEWSIMKRKRQKG
jgi:hypothetical protein